MKESNVQRSVWLALGAGICTLFRVNSGAAWLSGAGKAQRLTDGSVVVPAARPIALGFALANGKTVEGQSDLCGWTEIEVTAAMVGRKLPVFTAIETKESGGGRKSAEQKNFVQRVTEAGGIAGFAKSAAEAKSIIADWLHHVGGNPI